MDRHSSWQASSSLKSSSKSHLLFVGKKALNNTSYGAAVSEVEIDVLTGDRRMLRSDIHFDCGQSLNPAVDMGQVHLLLFWLIFQAAILPHQAMCRTRRWKHYEMLGCMNDWHLEDFSPSLRVIFRIQLPWPSPPYRSSFCCRRLKVLLFKGWASWPASRSLWMTPRERLSPTVHGITRYPQLQTSQQRCTLTFSRWSRPDLFLPALDEKDQSNKTSLIRREVNCSEENVGLIFVSITAISKHTCCLITAISKHTCCLTAVQGVGPQSIFQDGAVLCIHESKSICFLSRCQEYWCRTIPIDSIFEGWLAVCCRTHQTQKVFLAVKPQENHLYCCPPLCSML